MIQLENITFNYKKSEVILLNTSYSFHKGEMYYLIGDNGTGKTTLAKLILNILQPTKGTIRISDINTITYLPDYNGLYPHLSIMENIKYRLAIYHLDYETYVNQIEEYLKKYKLEQYKNTQVSLLSLGTKKKVAILCVAIIPSDLLILDEPTGGLDKESRNEVFTMLKDLKNEDKIILCITHDQIIIDSPIGKKITIKDKKVCEYYE